jgi:hypothetical protein
MSRRTQENIFAAIMLCLFGGYIAIAAGFGPNARLVPLPVAIIGFVCLLAQVLRQNLRTESETPSTQTTAETEARGPGGSELMALGFVAAFVVLIVAIGPVPAVFLFCAAYLATSRHYPVWKALSVAAAFAIAVYLLFVVGLELQLYHGVLEPLVDRF